MRHRVGMQPVWIGLMGLFWCALLGCSDVPGERADVLPRPAKIIEVGMSDAGTRSMPGRVEASQCVPMSFQVGGPLAEIAVTKGQKASRGDLLARIDPRDFEVNERNLAAGVVAARSQTQQAREEYGRVRGLFEHDHASKSEFDRARAAYEVAQARQEAAEQALNAARLALEDTELRAPYEGVVADRLVDAHQLVAPGQPVIMYQDAAGVEVRIHVPENQVAELTNGEEPELRVRFEALPGVEASARVKEFGTQSDPLTQTFPVTLAMSDAPVDQLLPGMTAEVTWQAPSSSSKPARVVVPLRVLFSDDQGDTCVWKVEDQTMALKRVQVKTGELTETGMEIREGLMAGDRILGAGVHFVTEGQVVRPLED